MQNYEEVKELFETLAERKRLTYAQKMFWGTAAIFAGDDETTDAIIAQMDDADRKFAVDLRHGSIPQIY